MIFPEKPKDAFRVRCIIWNCLSCKVSFVRVFADAENNTTVKIWESDPMLSTDSRTLDQWSDAQAFYGDHAMKWGDNARAN
jgi:hypothetical protein